MASRDSKVSDFKVKLIIQRLSEAQCELIQEKKYKGEARNNDSGSGNSEEELKCEVNTAHAQKRKRKRRPRTNQACVECDAVFKTKKSLQEHMCIEHFKKPPKEGCNAEGYSCEYCGKSFRFRAQLKQHVVIHTQEAQYLCEFCQRLYTNVGQLNIHRRLHTGEKPYKCPYCDECFHSTHARTRHRSKHERPRFYCTHCPEKQYVIKNDLLQHIRKIHTEKKLFKCVPCNRIFSSSSFLKRHFSSAHSEQDISTIEFGGKLAADEYGDFLPMEIEFKDDGQRTRMKMRDSGSSLVPGSDASDYFVRTSQMLLPDRSEFIGFLQVSNQDSGDVENGFSNEFDERNRLFDETSLKAETNDAVQTIRETEQNIKDSIVNTLPDSTDTSVATSETAGTLYMTPSKEECGNVQVVLQTHEQTQRGQEPSHINSNCVKTEPSSEIEQPVVTQNQSILDINQITSQNSSMESKQSNDLEPAHGNDIVSLEEEFHHDEVDEDLNVEASGSVMDKDAEHVTFFACELCQTMCATQADFEAHVAAVHAHPPQAHFCQICQAMFATEADLDAHMTSAHAQAYMCEFCAESFSDNDAYTQHLIQQEVDHMHLCDRCQIYFTRLQDFTQHNADVHSVIVFDYAPIEGDGDAKVCIETGDVYKCEECDVWVQSAETFRRHQEEHRRRKLELPSHTYQPTLPHSSDPVANSTIKQESLLDSGGGVKSTARTSDLSGFSGDVVSESMGLLHQQQDIINSVGAPSPKKSQLHQITALNFQHANTKISENTSSTFKVESKEFNESDGHFTCGICQAEFVEQRYLQKHLLTHRGEKDYTCKVCAFQFQQLRTLLLHMHGHTEDELRENYGTMGENGYEIKPDIVEMPTDKKKNKGSISNRSENTVVVPCEVATTQDGKQKVIELKQKVDPTAIAKEIQNQLRKGLKYSYLQNDSTGNTADDMMHEKQSNRKQSKTENTVDVQSKSGDNEVCIEIIVKENAKVLNQSTVVTKLDGNMDEAEDGDRNTGKQKRGRKRRGLAQKKREVLAEKKPRPESNHSGFDMEENDVINEESEKLESLKTSRYGRTIVPPRMKINSPEQITAQTEKSFTGPIICINNYATKPKRAHKTNENWNFNAHEFDPDEQTDPIIIEPSDPDFIASVSSQELVDHVMEGSNVSQNTSLKWKHQLKPVQIIPLQDSAYDKQHLKTMKITPLNVKSLTGRDKHDRFVHVKRIFRCTFCGTIYKNESNYKEHCQKCNSYKCKFCASEFDDETDYKEHSKDCRTLCSGGIKPKVKIPKETLTFYKKLKKLNKNSSRIKTHKQTKTPGVPEIRIASDIIENVHVTKTGSSGECEIDAWQSEDGNDDLDGHEMEIVNQQTFDPKKPLKCKICEKYFASKLVLKQHMKLHEQKLCCPYCEKVFKTNSEVVSHTKTVHPCGDYICEVCGRTFSSLIAYKSHKRVHKEKPNLIIYNCAQCDQNFDQRFKLKHHYNEVHLNIRKPKKQYTERFMCELCGKKFAFRSLLNQHRRLAHTDEKPFECEYCQKRFPRQGDLTVHKRSHTNERPYACSYCDEAFTQRVYLERHLVKHTGARDYKCEICMRAFPILQDYKKHVVNVHQERKDSDYKFGCRMCGKRFWYKSSCQRHEVKVHGLTSDLFTLSGTDHTETVIGFDSTGAAWDQVGPG